MANELPPPPDYAGLEDTLWGPVVRGLGGGKALDEWIDERLEYERQQTAAGAAKLAAAVAAASPGANAGLSFTPTNPFPGVNLDTAHFDDGHQFQWTVRSDEDLPADPPQVDLLGPLIDDVMRQLDGVPSVGDSAETAAPSKSRSTPAVPFGVSPILAVGAAGLVLAGAVLLGRGLLGSPSTSSIPTAQTTPSANASSAAVEGRCRAGAAVLGPPTTAEDLTLTGAVSGHVGRACGPATCTTSISSVQDVGATFHFVAMQAERAIGVVITIEAVGPTSFPFTSSANGIPEVGRLDETKLGTGKIILVESGTGSQRWNSTGGTIMFAAGDHGTINATLLGPSGTLQITGSFGTDAPCTSNR